MHYEKIVLVTMALVSVITDKKKIYFVNRESEADLNKFFIENESHAGWKN